jgi:hypothetical protein
MTDLQWSWSQVREADQAKKAALISYAHGRNAIKGCVT